jgi:hypothetical protein
MNGFDSLTEVLAGFGLTLSDRTALAFGAPTAKALSEVGDGGKVFVACKGGASILALAPKLSDDARKVARFIDATENEYGKVRPHVNTFLKGRKVSAVLNMIRDADENPIGFTVTRKVTK